MMDDKSEMATDVLCFMAVCLNEGWRIPIGYFFVGGLNGQGIKILIEY